jgi:hypothetical protein
MQFYSIYNRIKFKVLSSLITDDKDYFIKNTEDNWSGEKGELYD